MMRHGESVDNVLKVFPRDDCDLTELGRRQVRDNSKYLNEMNIDEVLVSPYIRTLQTYEEVSKYLDVPHKVYNDIHEVNSGLIKGLTFEESQNAFPEIMNNWMEDIFNVRLPNGESYSDALERVKGVIEYLKHNYCDSTVLLVTHGGFIRLMLAYVLEDISIYGKFDITNASLSAVTLGEHNKILYVNHVNR